MHLHRQEFVRDADPAPTAGVRNVGPGLAVRHSDTSPDGDRIGTCVTQPASGSPENLDPCQLVTQDEASTLAHATFGPGKEETISASGKECVYGYQTTNVMDIIVAQAAERRCGVWPRMPRSWPRRKP